MYFNFLSVCHKGLYNTSHGSIEELLAVTAPLIKVSEGLIQITDMFAFNFHSSHGQHFWCLLVVDQDHFHFIKNMSPVGTE